MQLMLRPTHEERGCVMNKEIYFNQDGVSISSSHLSVNGNTYTIESILFFRITETNFWRSLSFIFMILGFLLMVDEGPLFVIGGVIFFAGLLTWMNVHASYSLLITTSEAETTALVTFDKLFIEKMVEALYASMADYRERSASLKASVETSFNSSNNHQHLSF